MSESEEKYIEKRGWNKPRTMAFRRNAAQKAKAKLANIAGGSGPKHGFVIDSDWDYHINAPVKRKHAKQVWFTGQIRFLKKEARRKVRRDDEVASGNAYKKYYDIGWKIW